MDRVFHTDDRTHALVSRYCKSKGYNVKEWSSAILVQAVCDELVLPNKEEISTVNTYKYGSVPPKMDTVLVLKKGIKKEPGDMVYMNEVEDIWSQPPFWVNKK
jgi:hypothetical protein